MLFFNCHVLTGAPGGVIGLAAYLLISADTDVILFALGQLLNGRANVLCLFDGNRLGTLEVTGSRILELVTAYFSVLPPLHSHLAGLGALHAGQLDRCGCGNALHRCALGCTPSGVIVHLTDRLIGADTDVILLPFLQLAQRAGDGLIALNVQRFCAGELARRCVLHLIAGDCCVLGPLDGQLAGFGAGHAGQLGAGGVDGYIDLLHGCVVVGCRRCADGDGRLAHKILSDGDLAVLIHGDGLVVGLVGQLCAAFRLSTNAEALHLFRNRLIYSRRSNRISSSCNGELLCCGARIVPLKGDCNCIRAHIFARTRIR